jgi:hypothetical protein
MDLFDSATPEMKKKRNQKKDHHVMDLMIAFAADVEPNEVSYFANGKFRASRDLFGPLSSIETSPVSTSISLTTLVPHTSLLKQISGSSQISIHEYCIWGVFDAI